MDEYIFLLISLLWYFVVLWLMLKCQNLEPPDFLYLVSVGQGRGAWRSHLIHTEVMFLLSSAQKNITAQFNDSVYFHKITCQLCATCQPKWNVALIRSTSSMKCLIDAVTLNLSLQHVFMCRLAATCSLLL